MKDSLTPRDRTRLATFLTSPKRPENTLHYHQLQGLLCAVANAPELILPSDWLPVVFAGEEANYASADEAREMDLSMMLLYDEIGIDSESGELPADCPFHDDPMANVGPRAPVGQWATGFLVGYDWLSELWKESLGKDLETEFATTLMILNFLSQEPTEEYMVDLPNSPTLPKAAAHFLKMLPECIARYAALGLSLNPVSTSDETADLLPVTRIKVGRNKPCPCGSGKKYKKCCGR